MIINLGELSHAIKIIHGDSIEIRVARIKWHGPHEPITSWETYKQLPKDSTDEGIQEAVEDLLKNSKYFRRCKECSEVNLVGNMNLDVCHSCMAEDGVVF
jgi:hypothetical protein